MDNNKNQTILLILFILLLLGLIYYFQNNKETDTDENIKGATNSNYLQENSNPLVENQNEIDLITDGQTYVNELTTIRKEINSAFDDLNQKQTYTTLFDNNDLLESANNLLDKISAAKKEIRSLKISEKYNDANEKHIQSMDLLTVAVNNFIKLINSTEQNEKQKYNDLYNYNIEQSNKILETINIPS